MSTCRVGGHAAMRSPPPSQLAELPRNVWRESVGAGGIDRGESRLETGSRHVGARLTRTASLAAARMGAISLTLVGTKCTSTRPSPGRSP